MTVETGRSGTGNVAERGVIDITVNGQVFVRMTIQTVGRVGTKCDRIDNFLTRAVVTGITGTRTIGGDVMFDTFDLGPGRNHVTVVTGLTRSLVGEVTGAQGHGMGVQRMDIFKPVDVTGHAVATGREGLADCIADPDAVGVMTGETIVMNLRVGCISQRRRSAVTTCTAELCNIHQASVIRGVGGIVNRLPRAGVTAGAVARRRFAGGQADQGAVSGIVTAGTGIVGIHCCTNQGVIVTETASGANDGHDTCMIRCSDMGRFPSASVAGRTVTASGEVLADRQADQRATGYVVAGRTGVMNLRISVISQRRRIAVTAVTGRTGYSHQSAVIRRGGVQTLPGAGVTASTITSGSKGFTDRQAS